MTRFFCSTGLCTLQSAQLCHAQQQNATLRAQLAAVTAERDALAAQVAGLQDAARGALEGKEFYYRQYCELAKGANYGN